MSELSINVEQISKQYNIGLSKVRYDTLSDQMVESFKGLFSKRSKNKSKDNSFWALKDVSFKINQGELVGIVGHNGAGKSTLLKILSRITEPTLGRGEMYGRVGSLLEVGTGFHPELTGRENIYLNGAIIGMKKDEINRCFDAIVEFAEINKFIDMPVKRYSSGMYVRLAFSVSAHLKPEILMIDEVLSVGDLQFQRKCMDYANELKKSGATILFVSHNMFAIKSICKRVIYLSRGQVKADGPPEDVIPLFEKESSLGGLQSHDNGRSGMSEESIGITGMDLFNESGTQCAIFEFGERMRIRIDFIAHHELKNPNFVVAFIRSDGVACCNYSTALDNFFIDKVSGEGSIEVTTPPLKLVSESYTVQVLVWDREFKRNYCFQKGKNFHVRHHLFSTHFGVFHEDGEWSMGSHAAGLQLNNFTGGVLS